MGECQMRLRPKVDEGKEIKMRKPLIAIAGCLYILSLGVVASHAESSCMPNAPEGRAPPMGCKS
jgi:hypothetical protein